MTSSDIADVIRPRHVSWGYRAVLEVRGDDAVDVAERHVRRWINEKFSLAGQNVWDGRGPLVPRSGFDISVVNTTVEGSKRLYRIIDKNVGGTFVVTIAAAVEAAGRGHIVVSAGLAGASAADAIDGVATPGVTARILQDASIRDGGEKLTSPGVVVGAREIDRVRRAVLDPERTGFIFVAASPHASLDLEWRDVARSLTRGSVGLGNLFIVPAHLVGEVNAVLPKSLRIEGGQVRSFAPGVDPSGQSDGARHRVIGALTLERSTSRSAKGKLRVADALASAHARGARLNFLTRSLPSRVQETLSELDRAELAQQRAEAAAKRRERSRLEAINRIAAAMMPTPATQHEPSDGEHAVVEQPLTPAPDTAERPLVDHPPQERRGAESAGEVVLSALLPRLADLARRVLRREPSPDHVVDDLADFIEGQLEEVKAAEGQIDAEIAEHDATRRRAEALEDRTERAELEALDTQEELSRLRETVAWQRKRLRQHQDFSELVPDEMWTRVPSDVFELVDMLQPEQTTHPAASRVVFTVDSTDKAVAELREYDRAGSYSRAFWDYVRVLHDYAELKATAQFEGNVHTYLATDSVDGFKVPVKQHASNESETVLTNREWREERMRPVPRTVSAEGRVLMAAHFKPSHRDQFAPRFHYYDDTGAGGTGKVYVGYIGRHLTNTRT